MKLFINAKITYRTRIKLVVWLIKGCADNVTVTGAESGIDKPCSNSSLVLGFHFHTNDLGERHDSIFFCLQIWRIDWGLGWQPVHEMEIFEFKIVEKAKENPFTIMEVYRL